MWKNIPPDHKSTLISLKILINVIMFLYPDSKTTILRKFSCFLALFIKFSM